MNTTSSPVLSVSKPLPFLRASAAEVSRPDLSASASLRHSISASVFLGACVAIYFAAGYLALTLVERAWLALFS
jgi:hypothetical protein